MILAVDPGDAVVSPRRAVRLSLGLSEEGVDEHSAHTTGEHGEECGDTECRRRCRRQSGLSRPEETNDSEDSCNYGEHDDRHPQQREDLCDVEGQLVGSIGDEGCETRSDCLSDHKRYCHHEGRASDRIPGLRARVLATAGTWAWHRNRFFGHFASMAGRRCRRCPLQAHPPLDVDGVSLDSRRWGGPRSRLSPCAIKPSLTKICRSHDACGDPQKRCKCENGRVSSGRQLLGRAADITCRSQVRIPGTLLRSSSARPTSIPEALS